MPETNPITEAIALRIGLAARALPDVEPQRLIQVLLSLSHGAELSPLTMQAITVRRLKEGLNGALSDQPSEQLKEAVAYLRGEKAVTEAADALPEPAPYAEGDLPGSIRVALASNSSESLDGHFGTCVRFLVYQVSPAEARLVDVRRAETGRTETQDKKRPSRRAGEGLRPPLRRFHRRSGCGQGGAPRNPPDQTPHRR